MSHTKYNKTLAFLDIETTGMDVNKHEIIELGCVLVKEQDDGSYKIINEIDIKIQPAHIETAEPEALRVNGYDPAAWFFASSLKDALTELSAKADGAGCSHQDMECSRSATGFHSSFSG